MLQLTHLIGFMGGGKLTTLSFTSSASSINSSTVTAPSGILAGDLLVLGDFMGDASPPTATVPTNFNIAQNATEGTTYRLVLSWKIATGSESSASLTGMSGSAGGKVLLVFRGDVPIAVVSASSGGGQVTNAAPTNQSVVASGGIAPLIVIGSYNCASASVGTRGMSPAKDSEVASSNTRNYLGYKIYNASPADVTVSQNDSGNFNGLASCYLQCS